MVSKFGASLSILYSNPTAPFLAILYVFLSISLFSETGSRPNKYKSYKEAISKVKLIILLIAYGYFNTIS